MVLNQNKRPLNDGESWQCSHKHPRQLEYSTRSPLLFNISSCNSIFEKQLSPGGGDQVLGKSSGNERLAGVCIREFSAAARDKEVQGSSACTSEQESRSEPFLHVSFSSGFLEEGRFSRPGEIFSSFMNYPPRKIVPLGSDHQADVPLWSPQISCGKVDEDNLESVLGTCIIPMPDVNSSSPADDSNVGCGRIACYCPDDGSVRCVRQHVMEAREKLRVSLGQETFMELGFFDIGEAVATNWSEEDEHVFHEVVFSNPASIGKNFWDHLPLVFPSKSMKELVSYYFNVFMLRRRAAQNRIVPLHIDSDNDEWQGSDDGDEFGMTEEEEGDSGVESPVDQGVFLYDGNAHNDGVDDSGGISDDNDDICPSYGDVKQFNIVPESQICHKSGLTAIFVPPSDLSILRNGLDDQDVQDDSCTSYESQHNGADSHRGTDGCGRKQENGVEMDGNLCHTSYGNNGTREALEPGFVYCDPKVWDIGFPSGPKKDVDLLPTCNMMAEVFGEEAWNNNSSSDDSKGAPSSGAI